MELADLCLGVERLPEGQLEQKLCDDECLCVYHDSIPDLPARVDLLHEGVAENEHRVEYGYESCVLHHADDHEYVADGVRVGHENLAHKGHVLPEYPRERRLLLRPRHQSHVDVGRLVDHPLLPLLLDVREHPPLQLGVHVRLSLLHLPHNPVQVLPTRDEHHLVSQVFLQPDQQPHKHTQLTYHVLQHLMVTQFARHLLSDKGRVVSDNLIWEGISLAAFLSLVVLTGGTAYEFLVVIDPLDEAPVRLLDLDVLHHAGGLSDSLPDLEPTLLFPGRRGFLVKRELHLLLDVEVGQLLLPLREELLERLEHVVHLALLQLLLPDLLDLQVVHPLDV